MIGASDGVELETGTTELLTGNEAELVGMVTDEIISLFDEVGVVMGVVTCIAVLLHAAADEDARCGCGFHY